ncbi:major facilitator superfamily domain-containing protein [Mycena albidolilacea]|uniref:Major facilitator superfamily domain-containing protein n=1 Tax=Mycena albidolilacea TaxID=1033008 RepID=A0AAD6ZR80_9AGAR|nr:major facilitator superfamily domain-containing protein [Mycena albidolilacea]
MSTQLPDDERVPLLDPVPDSDLPPAPESFPTSRGWLGRFSGATLIVPLALLCRVATLIPTTTTFYILHQFICRRYYLTHDPARIPPDGRMPDELCALPVIDESYAAFMALVALMDGIGSLGGYAALSFLAARLGRRAAMATVLGVGLGADLALIASTLVAPRLEVPLFALWLISASFSQANLVAFVTNIYLVDLVHEDNRTSALSSLAGWAALGSVLSFSVGGTITTRGGNLLAVYMVAGTLWIIGLLYVWLVLPESFPKAKRDALRRERQRQVTPGRWRVLSGPAAVLAPLKHLAPVRDLQTGRRNWRLLICAVHMLLVGLGGGYAVASIVTIVTSLYQYKPHETGYMLTALGGTNMFVLTLAIPFLVRVLRPLYRRSSIQLPMGDDAEVVEATDRLDVHIAFVSWVTEAAACLIFGYMRTRATQLAAVILIGCGPGYGPAVRSLVAASVEPLKQGETLGAIEMVWGLGLFFSPLLMGSILSATITSVPQTVFYVQAGIVISAAGILLLVRDADRYHKSLN